MKQIDFTLYEKDGEIIFRNKKQLLADLKASGWREMEGVIRKKSKYRSVQQNRYYWYNGNGRLPAARKPLLNPWKDLNRLL